MDNFKVVYVKYDDSGILLEKLKNIMADYDMNLIGIDENKYTFDRDRSYSRSFIIDNAMNGWISLLDEHETQAEELTLELSNALSCFAMCIGIHGDMLHYLIYEKGEQTGQYMSSLKYYEYKVDDDVTNTYKGDASIFGSMLSDDDTHSLQSMLDGCREGNIDAYEVYNSIRIMTGIIIKENEEDEIEDDPLITTELFYVDFESINIKTDDIENVTIALDQVVNKLGYIRVEDFKNEDGEKKSLFKKIINSVFESKRLKFYISPVCNGWVTLVGEKEKLIGGNPEDWEFLHIESDMSNILKTQVINIFADNESWGFKVFENGRKNYKYSSDGEFVNFLDITNLFPDLTEDEFDRIFDRTLLDTKDVDEVFKEFSITLGIKNYKINIPMDYSEEEYSSTVLEKLPDGANFLNLKYAECK